MAPHAMVMKAKREEFAGEDGAGAIDELGERRKLQARVSEEDAEREQKDDAKFDEGAEVIARGQEQPDGQNAGGESVDDDGESEGDAGPGKPDGPGG